MTQLMPLDHSVLPPGIRARFVNNGNGLNMHVLEAGFDHPGRPSILLLHGFPELAYSWRKVILPLARAGFHVIAPDQRGYGRTSGGDSDYDGDVGSSGLLNLATDALGLIAALGYRSVTCVVGHDFGSPVAAYCALIRPDVFRSVVLMSAPFAGSPSLPFNSAIEDSRATANSAKKRSAENTRSTTASSRASADVNAPAAASYSSKEHALPAKASSVASIDADMAALDPPRKHYQWYYSSREANEDMHHCPQGVHSFLRAYYHYKSADWKQNKPFRLKCWSATELAQLPAYYVMERARGMAETVASQMPSAAEIEACRWLTERELSVYSAEYGRNGFQGGLQWYRCRTDERYGAELKIFSGRTIDVPSCFIAGKSDWGIYQRPGDIEAMQNSACTRMQGSHLVDGAGHWVQQEQAEEVTRLLLDFLQAQTLPRREA